MMLPKGILRCNLCGKEERLRLIELTMWVCEKDKERIEKLINKLKTARTRFTSIESWKSRHQL